MRGRDQRWDIRQERYLAAAGEAQLAGAALPRGNAQDYGFLFLVVDPARMLPGNEFAAQMSDLVRAIKATPRQPGAPEIRIPSERAFRERTRRRVEGIVIDRAVIATLEAL